jgi:glycerophosphoryl diester phosphodiesterase
MAHQLQRVAHRGGSHLAPENTLAAFRNALTMPIDAIELDVQMTRDGEAIVFHDNTVDRVTDGTGNILDLDFAYLRSLNAAAHFPGGWPQPEQIPTLREVLDLARGRINIYIEIKASKRDGVHDRYPHIVETVVDTVRAAKMLDRVLIISFDWSVLPQVRSLEPSLQTGMLVSRDVWSPQSERALKNLCKQASSLGCSWINMDRKLFSDDMPSFVQAYGFKLGIWTVNTLDELRRLAVAGVNSLTTDRPDLFSQP